MSIPVPIWARIDLLVNQYYYPYSTPPTFPSIFFSVSSYFFLVAGVVCFPLALLLSRYSIQQILEITFGSRSDDVVGHIVGRRVYSFTTLYFVSSSLFWSLTVVHGLIGVLITNGDVDKLHRIYSDHSYQTSSVYHDILFLQGAYQNNPLILWVFFGLWAASLELLTYSTYFLVGQKLVHLDQKNDTIPYRLLAVLIPIKFIYLFLMRGIGGPYTLVYIYAANYLVLFIEIALFWQYGWLLVKKMTNAYELRPDTDGHNMRYFCKLALVFIPFWLLSLVKYVLYCLTAAAAYPVSRQDYFFLAQVSLNLSYIWFSVIQAVASLLIVTVYTLKQ